MENFDVGNNHNGEDYYDDNDEYEDYVYDEVNSLSPVVILPEPVSGSQTAVKGRNEENILIAKSKFFRRMIWEST